MSYVDWLIYLYAPDHSFIVVGLQTDSSIVFTQASLPRRFWTWHLQWTAREAWVLTLNKLVRF